MADLTITAADVLTTTSTRTYTGVAGATVTAGQPVYADATDSGKYKPADADADASSRAIGIAVHGASSGQPLTVAQYGNLTISAVMTAGEVYAVSATAGGIAPVGDLVTGNYVTVLGVATTTSNLQLGTIYSATAKP
jgi:hypothetical protein